MSKTKILMIIVIFITFSMSRAYASLSAHPVQIYETVIKGQKNYLTLHIANAGPSGSLGYQISATEPWISFSSTSGEIPISDSIEIKLIVDATSLNSGLYKADILIGDPHHGPITVPIEILVSMVADVYESSDNNSLMLQAYPNPFNSTTVINYTLPESQYVIINLLDIRGSQIKVLANEFQTEGIHRINFDGSELPSGIYFITLNTQSYSIVRKLIINK
ncbi:MAG: T9SS type A sorting domain-containing protein [Candidatus Kapabacteria bacterium]|nr:T9SS type A sorting domain-containing protein [Ignavibacteriota bacterium]MCW5885358.1 T9SS type A sorting domain-containing protein [Candidatus Kapabacteria bacterium]